MQEELTILTLKIENRNPVELLSLTRSMQAISAQFDRFNKKHGQNSEAKLYVNEVRRGSIILELFNISDTLALIPFVENINIVFEFATYLKQIYSYFLGECSEKPPLEASDCEQLSQIVNPVAQDNGSTFNVYIHNNEGNINFNISSMEANVIQNRLKQEQKSLMYQDKGAIYSKQLLSLVQASEANKGNKGIIETITSKPLNLIFNNDSDKKKILSNPSINPLKHIFVVDVKILEINKKLVARIVNYYEDESFPCEDI